MGLLRTMLDCELSIQFGPVRFRRGARALARERHAERQHHLAFVQAPAWHLPLRPSGQRPRQGTVLKAPEQGQKLGAWLSSLMIGFMVDISPSGHRCSWPA